GRRAAIEAPARRDPDLEAWSRRGVEGCAALPVRAEPHFLGEDWLLAVGPALQLHHPVSAWEGCSPGGAHDGGGDARSHPDPYKVHPVCSPLHSRFYAQY